MSKDVPITTYAPTAIGRLSWLLAWTWLAAAHGVALALGLVALWWFQVQPQAVQAIAQDWIAASLWHVLTGIGVSLLTVLAAYWYGARWLSRRIDLAIRRYLVSGL